MLMMLVLMLMLMMLMGVGVGVDDFLDADEPVGNVVATTIQSLD